jgi:FkbM family methyltransferase
MSGNAIGIEDYEDNMPLAKIAAESGDIGFYVPSRMAAFRVQTLFSKEPDTIQWISTFEDGGTFIDVGANVGMYTIWVAMQRAMRVLAFEPEAQNYALLNRNILLNNLGSRVAAYCLALGDEERFTMLNVSDTRIGGSFSTLHGFVNSAAAPEPGAHAKETVFRQGCVSASLDQVLTETDAAAPIYLKIDVDGIEPMVIAGAENLLKNAGLRSILIELDPGRTAHRKTFDRIMAAGFSPDAASRSRWADGVSSNSIFWR